MSTAVLTPQPDGRCLFELNGVTHPFESYESAEAEALARGLPFTVDRFPLPPVTPVATGKAPGLQVL